MNGMKFRPKRMLLIADCLPYPPDNPKQARVFRIIKTFKEYFDIYLLCFASEPSSTFESMLRKSCRDVRCIRHQEQGGHLRRAKAHLTGKSFIQNRYASPEAYKVLRNWSAGGKFDAVIANSVYLNQYVQVAPSAVSIMDMDAQSVLLEQSLKSAGGLAKRFLNKDILDTKKLEKWAVEGTNVSVWRTSEDAMKAPLSNSMLQVIPDGIDIELFKPAESIRKRPFSVILSGDLENKMNVDGILWFVENVWSGIKVGYMKATLWIVGKNPSKELMKLQKLEGVNIKKPFPDIRPFYDSASIAIAPCRGGQSNILEYMAMGLATVATSQALRGCNFSSGHEIIKADTPEEWQYGIKMLFANESYRRKIASAGRAAVEERYSWMRFDEAFISLMNKLIPDTIPLQDQIPLPPASTFAAPALSSNIQPQHDIDILSAYEKEFG